MNKLLKFACVAYGLIGFVLVVLGAVLPEILEHYGKNYEDGGLLVFMQFIGMLFGVLSMPIFIRQFGRKLAVGFGLVLIALEICNTLLPPWPVMMGLVVLEGFGAGLVESCIGTIILVAIKERQAVAFSLLEVAFGVGALVLPFISSYLIVQGLWVYSFLVLGASSMLLLFIWFRLSFGEIDAFLTRQKSGKSHTADTGNSFASSEAEKESSPKRTGGLIMFIICASFFFFYGGTEVSIVHFFPSIFLEEWSLSSSNAAMAVTVFWASMIIGRIFCGIIAERISYFRYLLYSALGALLTLLWIALSSSIWAGFVLIFMLGLFMAGMFSIFLIYANQSMNGHTERNTSLLLASNGLGGAIIPILVGGYMDRFPVKSSFWLFTVFAAALLIFVLLLKQSRKMNAVVQRTVEAGTEY